jgi:hypothetical protein
MACLVQQLFRMKIGQELDTNLFDDVLFPLLRSRKQLARELLLDIKLTQSCNEHGLSAIVICRVIDHNDDVPQEDTPKNISPFEVPLRSLKHPQIRDHPPSNPEDQEDWPSEFEDVYLSLQEQPLWPRVSAEKIADDLNFVNDYLEDALNNGKRISWGGDPTLPNNFDAILSTYYY